MRFYEQAFREMGLEWIPSQGNFILVKVGPVSYTHLPPHQNVSYGLTYQGLLQPF